VGMSLKEDSAIVVERKMLQLLVWLVAIFSMVIFATSAERKSVHRLVLLIII